MIVIVGEHGGAVHVFTGGTDAQNSCVAVADDFAQTIFAVTGAQTPDFRRVAQFGLAVFDVEIDRCRRYAFNDDAVVARGFEIGRPVAAGGAAAESRVGQRA